MTSMASAALALRGHTVWAGSNVEAACGFSTGIGNGDQGGGQGPPNGPCACFGCGKLESHQREFKRCVYCPTATYCSRCGWGGMGGTLPLAG
jgi:hypothetical protein